MIEYIKKFYELLVEHLTGLTFFNVPVINIITFIVLVFLFIIAFYIVKSIVLRRLETVTKKSATKLDDTIVTIFREVKFIFFAVFSLYIATRLVEIGKTPTKVVKVLFIFVLMYEVVKLVQNVGVYLLERYWVLNEESPEKSEENRTAVNGIILLMKITVWIIGVLIVLNNLGVKISALVASLGISSIAVAFALQNILADIFSSFSIYFDKPFKVGDFVVIGNDKGTIKKIGIKTTRIVTLQGEELVVSNHELTSTRIHNYKQMEKRRVAFKIGVVYETPVEKLRKIPNIIETIIQAQDTADFDRAHFFSFGDFSLDFEIVYYVINGDYNVYMDTQQSINLGIFEHFENEGIEFAYPTAVQYTKHVTD